MQSLAFYEPVRQELLEVEDALHAIGRTAAPPVVPFLEHILNSSGKRLRPAITLLAGRFYDYDRDKLILIATAVELMHIGTLIHDDTVDHADRRRGRATLSSLWGHSVAVLVGDYVLAHAADIACATEDTRVLKLVVRAAMALSSGELRELICAFKLETARQQYWDRVADKTASLFATAAESGAVLSRAPEEAVRSLREFGYSLGMAFQIVDDILDFQGDEGEMGKPAGSDLMHGVLTLPAILLLERHPGANPVEKAFKGEDREANLKRALDMVQNSDILQECCRTAEKYCQAARSALLTLPDNEARQSLMTITDYVVERRL